MQSKQSSLSGCRRCTEWTFRVSCWEEQVELWHQQLQHFNTDFQEVGIVNNLCNSICVSVRVTFFVCCPWFGENIVFILSFCFHFSYLFLIFIFIFKNSICNLKKKRSLMTRLYLTCYSFVPKKYILKCQNLYLQTLYIHHSIWNMMNYGLTRQFFTVFIVVL